jgi:acetoin utilization protein AcuB
MKVSDIMSSRIRTIDLDATLAKAKEIMLNHRIRNLPVIDDDKKLAGIITINDVEKNLSSRLGTVNEIESDRNTLQIRVHRIMTRKPFVISSDAYVAQAAKAFLENKINCLPVSGKKGKIVGFLTVSDVLRLLSRDDVTLEFS